MARAPVMQQRESPGAASVGVLREEGELPALSNDHRDPVVREPLGPVDHLSRSVDQIAGRPIAEIHDSQTTRLDVAGMKALLLKLDFMQRIARGEHPAAQD